MESSFIRNIGGLLIIIVIYSHTIPGYFPTIVVTIVKCNRDWISDNVMSHLLKIQMHARRLARLRALTTGLKDCPEYARSFAVTCTRV
jgi:hypothetical protein